MTWYVARKGDGSIAMIGREWQKGYNDEQLPDNDPAVIAFLAPPPPTSLDQLIQYNEYMLLMLIELINALLTKPVNSVVAGQPLINGAMFSATRQ